MDVAGADCLHQFPKCRSEKELEEHLDAWEEMLDKYGGQLIEYAPGHVRVMLIKTLPHDIENELLDHPELDPGKISRRYAQEVDLQTPEALGIVY